MSEADEMTSSAGWCAPAEWIDVSRDPPGNGALDLPAITIRRGGIRYPDPPTTPTIRLRRIGYWRRHRWAWVAGTPISDARSSRSWAGTTHTRWGARRAAVKAIRSDPNWADWRPR